MKFITWNMQGSGGGGGSKEALWSNAVYFTSVAGWDAVCLQECGEPPASVKAGEVHGRRSWNLYPGNSKIKCYEVATKKRKFREEEMAVPLPEYYVTYFQWDDGSATGTAHGANRVNQAIITRTKPDGAFVLDSVYRPLLTVQVRLTGYQVVNICDIHAAKSGNDVRALVSRANTLSNFGPIAMLGDFNRAPMQTRALLPPGFHVIAPLAPTHTKGKTLDYMCEKNLNFLGNSRVDVLPNLGSDHWPVMFSR